MRVLLDTNVISEMTRDRPDPNVVAWLENLGPQDAFYSAMTIGELRKGIELCADLNFKAKLERWFNTAILTLGEQILPVNVQVAQEWGLLEAASKRTLSTTDALIFATARAHGLDVLTRNTKDFDLPGVRVIDPWTAPVPGKKVDS